MNEFSKWKTNLNYPKQPGQSQTKIYRGARKKKELHFSISFGFILSILWLREVVSHYIFGTHDNKILYISALKHDVIAKANTSKLSHGQIT